MGEVFEKMCRYHVLEKGINGDYGNFITKVGNWWGNEMLVDESGNRRVNPTDIDIVGLSGLDKTMVIGECKFKNEKTGKSAFDALFKRGKQIEGKYKIVRYIIYSLNGYTDWYEDLHDPQLELNTIDDLYQ